MPKGNPHPKPSPGRKKGEPNKSTKELRDRIIAFLDSPDADFSKLAKGLTPKELADFIAKLLPYVVARPELTVGLKGEGGFRLEVVKVERQ